MSDWPIEIPYRIDLFSGFMLLGVMQGFFISYFFWIKRKEISDVQKYLGLLVFGFTLVILEIFLCYTGYIIHLIHYYDLSEPINFVLAPLMFLISVALAKKSPKKFWWHFIPFFLYTLYCGFFFFQSGLYKFDSYLWSNHPQISQLQILPRWPEDPLGIKGIVNELALLQISCYVPFIITNLRNWKNNQQSNYKINKWLLGIYFLFALNFLLWLYKTFFSNRDLYDNILASVDTLLIYYVSFNLLKQSKLLQENLQKGKYAKSTLPEAFKKSILKNLINKMETEKLFLNPDLSLKSLATELNVSTHHLSQVLNEKLEKRFYDFVAEYRVAEAKRLLSSPEEQNLTLIHIASKSGFKSKSSFNNTFKKIMGLTPSAFRKEQQENN